MDTAFLQRAIDQAVGRDRADLVIKGARIVNVVTGELESGDIAICGDRIVGTYDDYRGEREISGNGLFAVSGFIDTHVHPESTLVTPAQFDQCVLPRGTTTAIADPHEIANVLGLEGLHYFLKSAGHTALDLRIQLSSCVPSSSLETSGARLLAEDLVPLRDHPQVIGLAEVMNFPGLLAKEPEVLAKVAAFQDGHIDGHAPLVTGRALNAYLACRVRNCHETTSLEEGQEKLRKGMQVLIREGSVSKDLAALAPLVAERTSAFVGLCTDDRNPLDIADEGHIDHLIRTAIGLGAPPIDVFRAATWSAARGFGLTDRGLVAPGQRADIVLLGDLETCAVHSVIRGGQLVDAQTFAGRPQVPPVGLRSIKLDPVEASVFACSGSGPTTPVIGVVDGRIITERLSKAVPYANGYRSADLANDVLKIAVLERHGINRNVGRGFVKGFGLAGGALASSVGHDSHNICVVGTNDADMAVAVNRLIELQGGFAAARDGQIVAELALPLAGLMSLGTSAEVEAGLRRLRAGVRTMGCPLAEPFLQLAFLPLPVIPHLKITDHGMVDVDRMEVVGH